MAKRIDWTKEWNDFKRRIDADSSLSRPEFYQLLEVITTDVGNIVWESMGDDSDDEDA